MAEDTLPGASRTAPSLPAPTYQWVLCDDDQVHAVWDDTINSSAHTGEPWIGVCGHQIAMYTGQPKESATVCWPCIDEIRTKPDAVQAPWRGKTL